MLNNGCSRCFRVRVKRKKYKTHQVAITGECRIIEENKEPFVGVGAKNISPYTNILIDIFCKSCKLEKSVLGWNSKHFIPLNLLVKWKFFVNLVQLGKNDSLSVKNTRSDPNWWNYKKKGRTIVFQDMSKSIWGK